MNMIKMSQALLGVYEGLFTYMRSSPSDPVYLGFVVELGQAFACWLANGDKAVRALREHFEAIRDSSDAHAQIIGYIVDMSFAQSNQIDIDEKDHNLMCSICSWAQRLIDRGNSELTYSYADAFHGVSNAIARGILDRSEYYSLYFKPFLDAWPSFLQPEEVQLLEKWKKSERRSGEDKWGSALK